MAFYEVMDEQTNPVCPSEALEEGRLYLEMDAPAPSLCAVSRAVMPEVA